MDTAKLRRIITAVIFGAFIIALAVVMIIPIILTCVSSFEGGFGGYVDFLLWKPMYLRAFMNSVIMAGSAAVLSVAIAIPAAYVFAKVKFRGSAVLFYVYIIVMMMPFQVTLLPQYIVSKTTGIYDTLLAVIIPAIFNPFAVFLLTQIMKTLPNEYIEAARLDTGSTLKIIRHIIIPVMQTGIICTFVLVFTENWNMVEQPLVLLETLEKYPLSVMISDFSARAGDLGAAAASVVIMIPPLLLYMFFKDEITEGLASYKLK